MVGTHPSITGLRYEILRRCLIWACGCSQRYGCMRRLSPAKRDMHVIHFRHHMSSRHGQLPRHSKHSVPYRRAHTRRICISAHHDKEMESYWFPKVKLSMRSVVTQRARASPPLRLLHSRQALPSPRREEGGRRLAPRSSECTRAQTVHRRRVRACGAIGATGIDRSRTLPRRLHGSDSLLSCPSSSWNDSPRYSKRLEDRALVVRELACDDPGNVLDGQPGFPRLIYLSVELWFVLRGTIFSSCRCNCRGDHAARPGTVLIRAQSLDGCCP
jgi:hypothetical protein